MQGGVGAKIGRYEYNRARVSKCNEWDRNDAKIERQKRGKQLRENDAGIDQRTSKAERAQKGQLWEGAKENMTTEVIGPETGKKEGLSWHLAVDGWDAPKPVLPFQGLTAC